MDSDPSFFQRMSVFELTVLTESRFLNVAEQKMISGMDRDLNAEDAENERSKFRLYAF